MGCGYRSGPGGRFILISLDTLRADHLGAYGYSRPTSPFIDSLAARGTLFENAVVQLPGTLPSHMSIFTGLYPAEHAVYPPDAVLSRRLLTLPEVFRGNGFRTAGHAEGGYMEGHYGFARGFEEFTSETSVEGSETRRKSWDAVRRTFGRGLEFLRRLDESAPFFLFLHSYAVHAPYDPPERYRSLYWPGSPPPGAQPADGPVFVAFNRGEGQITAEAREYYRALYDAQINATDDVVKDFFADLDELGLAQDVTVVLTSDHGEEFLEHGKMAHEQVYHECLHVPLLVLQPGQRQAQRVSALVRSIDIAPTLYDLAGLPEEARPRVSGRSLAPLIRGASPPRAQEAYAEAFVSRDRALYRQSRRGSLFVLVQREISAEGALPPSRSELFDLASDRLQRRDLSQAQPARTRELVERLQTYRWQASAPPDRQTPSGEQQERLRALGYVE
jgi:arylsulfatase A-like enzyme